MAGTLIAYDFVTKAIAEKNLELKPDDVGTGVFKIPNPAEGPLAHTTVLVEKITLDDARLRALRCEESSWIPEAVETFDEIQSRDKYCGQGCQSTSECGGTSQCWWCRIFTGCVE